MEIIESINTLSWPAAVAIVGSVATIVIGLFGYLRSTNAKPEATPTPTPTPISSHDVHDKMVILKDEVAELDGDFKALTVRVEAIQRELKIHEARDVADFKALNIKVEKIMEIIVEMLRGNP